MNKYIGDNFQLYGVERYILQEGKARGMEIFHVKNGLGLELTISLDRNCDITSLTYKGNNMSFLSSNGYVSSCYYDDKKNGFLKSFTAGFLTTCGLTTFGTPTFDDGEELPLHGTISNTPTKGAFYEIKDNEIIIKSTTYDEHIFDRKLVLKRTITISLLKNEFFIHDEVANNGDKISPLMILYHMNMGYPLLDENSILKINSTNVTARNEYAKEGIKYWNMMEKPTNNYEEMCYYHEIKDLGDVMIFNPKINCGLNIKYDAKELNSFTEWKMMGVRDYVLGLEPGNAYPDGRANVRKNNKLNFIKPNEIKTFNLKIELLDKIK